MWPFKKNKKVQVQKENNKEQKEKYEEKCKRDHDLIEEVYSQINGVIKELEKDDNSTERDALAAVNIVISRNTFSLQNILMTHKGISFDRTRASDILYHLIFHFKEKTVYTNPGDSDSRATTVTQVRY